MKSPDPPRPARAAPASTPVIAGADSASPVAAERAAPMPTESATKPTLSAAPSAGRKSSGSKSANTREGTDPRPAGPRAGNEERSTSATTGARSREADVSRTALAALSSLTRPGTLRPVTTGTEHVDGTEGKPTGTTKAGTAEAGVAVEKKGGSSGSTLSRATDALSSSSAATDTATTATAGAQADTARRGARGLLRGTHRTVLTVAAVTGVVLVAGVLVGLRGGGSGHGKATPDPAATLLDPGGNGGAQAGVPGALLPSAGHRSGATPDAVAADDTSHTGHSSTGDGKHAASGTDKGGSHAGSSSGSSSSSHSSGTSAGHSSSSAPHPAAQQTAPSAHATAPASSGGSTASGVMVFSHASGRCLTVAGGQGKDGSPLEIRDCSGSSAQKWTFASDGTIRAFGLCMDAAGASTANGTVVQLAKCNGGPAQQFRLNVRQDLTSVLADKCVDVKDQQTANGTRLQLWSCAGTDNQKWSKK